MQSAGGNNAAPTGIIPARLKAKQLPTAFQHMNHVVYFISTLRAALH